MTEPNLSRRERRIMDLLFEHRHMSVGQVNHALADESSYSSTRASLSRLVDKKLLKHVQDGAKYVFSPVEDEKSAGHLAIRRVMDIFFRGSPLATIDAVLKFSGDSISAEELEEINALISKIDSKTEPDL